MVSAKFFQEILLSQISMQAIAHMTRCVVLYEVEDRNCRAKVHRHHLGNVKQLRCPLSPICVADALPIQSAPSFVSQGWFRGGQ